MNIKVIKINDVVGVSARPRLSTHFSLLVISNKSETCASILFLRHRVLWPGNRKSSDEVRLIPMIVSTSRSIMF